MIKVASMLWFASLVVPDPVLAEPEIDGKEESAMFEGPGRYCGYGAIIDMLPNETVEPLGGGFHGGFIRWTGEFGQLDVSSSGWVGKPKGRRFTHTDRGHIRFTQRKRADEYEIKVWNGEHGMATFRSVKRITKTQLKAIDRIDLFNEGETPDNCEYRMYFAGFGVE